MRFVMLALIITIKVSLVFADMKDTTLVKLLSSDRLALDSIAYSSIMTDTIKNKNEYTVISKFSVPNFKIKYEITFSSKNLNKNSAAFQYKKASIYINNFRIALARFNYFPLEVFGTGQYNDNRNNTFICKTKSETYLISGGSVYDWMGRGADQIYYLIIGLNNKTVTITNSYPYEFINLFGFYTYDLDNDGCIEIWNQKNSFSYFKGEILNNELEFHLYIIKTQTYYKNCNFTLKESLGESIVNYEILKANLGCFK